MFFLLRACFWLGLVALVLGVPVFPAISPSSSGTARPETSATAVASVAGGAVSQLVAACVQRPQACRDGAQSAAAIASQGGLGDAFNAKVDYGVALLTAALGQSSAPPRAPPSTAQPPATIHAPRTIPLPPRRAVP